MHRIRGDLVGDRVAPDRQSLTASAQTDRRTCAGTGAFRLRCREACIYLPATVALSAVLKTEEVEGTTVVCSAGAKRRALVDGHVIRSRARRAQDANVVDQVLVTASINPPVGDSGGLAGVERRTC